MKHTLFGRCIGAAAAILLLVGACSDDAPAGVDAQLACNCPAAEPPLAGRIVRVTQSTAIDPNITGGTSAVCPTDGVLLGGGCEPGTPGPLMLLMQANPVEELAEFSCLYYNQDANIANTVIVKAICLVPPE